ncbi:MAG: DUF402 domain-containing protein [Candidatus Latescibacteria bacterium]|nr:DUF402 domain-containing protein [Candidatus Latescibacterota bacterium]
MLKTTVIRKIRRQENIGRWPVYVMSHDRHGLWLYSPKGTIYRLQAGSKIVECEVGGGPGGVGHPVMFLVPHEAWWTASWSLKGAIAISVDICTPPTLVDDEWSFSDLKLDPLAFFDGHVEIDDEDEFIDACEGGLISPNEAVKARDTATKIEQSLRDHTEPFGRTGWNKLGEAISLSLPPIKQLRHVPTA